MQIRKMGKKIFGASLTSAEQKAMNMEIQKQIAEYDRKNIMEIDAMILWCLHVQFGFGPKRLKRFFDNFVPNIDELAKRYEMDDSDKIWLCTQKLKDYGIDVESWHGEKERRESR